MQGIKKASLVAAMASVLLVAAGCGSSTESTGAAGGVSSAEPAQFAASAQTKQALGVDHWSRQESAGHTLIAGEDAAGTVRVRFEQTITTDSAGVLGGSDGSLVQTKSVVPLNLVAPGSPLLAAGRCGAAIVATICIVAALCGLGGESGAEVLAATVEAGTEQCK